MIGSTRKFSFKNSDGETLDARLELPVNKPRGFALFAHCFTCSKDFSAASRISRKLSHLGIGVLRFDFTGLGNSEGDFANTNFSSNVQDLVSAYEALTKEFEAPCLLIGHSLGGAAVLKAATLLNDVKGVVTINAPSEVEHVSHLFEDDLSKIESEGSAEVNLAGRKFTIKNQFVQDLKGHKFLDDLKNTRKSFLILHSPTDNTVSIDHAGEIFMSVKHPKSFISLDGADHLLMQKKDAEYAAYIISAWAEKHLPSLEEKHPKVEGHIEIHSRPGHKFTQDIYSDRHHLVADEPPKVKGDDLGMDPYELLLSSLGACTAMTMRMYADHKKLPLEDIRVVLSHEKRHLNDAENSENQEIKLDHIDKKIELTGNLTEDEIARIKEIAERCPVNRTLKSKIIIQQVD